MLISSTLALVTAEMDFIHHFRYEPNSLIIGASRDSLNKNIQRLSRAYGRRCVKR
jgi:hypothetical protein